MNIKKVLIIAIIATAPLHGMQKKSSKSAHNREQQNQKKITILQAIGPIVLVSMGVNFAINMATIGKLHGELGRNPVINQQSPICTVQQPICTVTENHLAAFLSHGPAKKMTQCNPLEEIDYLKNAITVKNEETAKLQFAKEVTQCNPLEEIDHLKNAITVKNEETAKLQFVFEKVIEKRWEQITKIAHLEEEIAALKEPFYKKLFRR